MWRQLVLTWLAGSAITGTLAVLFTHDTGGPPFTVAVPLFALVAGLPAKPKRMTAAAAVVTATALLVGLCCSTAGSRS